MSRKKLAKAPLKEVIFELFWKMRTGPGGEPFDPGYNLAVGGFAQQIRDSFPIRKSILPEGVSVYPHPQYQFWKDEATWPVIQIGPGLLTVNDTDKNYSWEGNFRANIELALNTLTDSYEDLPKFEKARLKYIDAIDITSESEIENTFLEKLQTSVNRQYVLPGKLKGLAVRQSNALDDGSIFSIDINSGRNNLTSTQAVIWTTTIEKKGDFERTKLFQWLDSAHNLTSEMFVKLLNPSFYEQLDS